MAFRIIHPLDGKLFEWAFSVPMILLGVSMLLWHKIFHGSILRILVDSIGGITTAMALIIVGMLGIAALVANGSSLKIGPHIRSLSALTRAVLWTTFALSMGEVSVAQGFLSPMVFFWSSFAVTEMYICWRAALDVRNGR